MTQPIADYAAFLGEARLAVERLDQVQKDCNQLEQEEKQLKRQLEGEKKAVEDSVSLIIKKRREEINSSYDKQITKGQDRLKKAKGKRERAKNQGIKERIEEETAVLREEIRQQRQKLKGIFQRERMPSFCRKEWYYALYMPRTLKEIGMLLLTVLIVFAALPWGVYLMIPAEKSQSWMLILIYLVDIVLFGGLYLMVGNRTKTGHLDVVKQGRKIYDSIHGNQKKIKAITRSIRRDRNESIYNLEKYDDEIARITQELADLTAKKQEALNTFDTVTQTIIADEIVSNSKDKLEQMERDHERTEGRLKETEQRMKELSLEITNKYEIYVGKEFMQPDKLADLARLIRTGQAVNLSDAIFVYKAGKTT